MRRLSVGLVVAAAIALAPLWAQAGNQQVAEQIAASLRQSGQLQSYKIGVKYQDGTAWLRGRVASNEQMDAALRVVSQTPGVTRVVNDLSLTGQNATSTLQQTAGAMNAERVPRSVPSTGYAERVPVSFAAAPVQQVAATAMVPTLAPPLPPLTSQPTIAPYPAMARRSPQPVPIAYTQGGAAPMPLQQGGGPVPQYVSPVGGVAPAQYDQPHLPNHAWPGYAAYPNYAGLTYPKQYSPTAWPYIGPFYPYPQVPLGWRKVTMEWHDGWWQLDFDDGPRSKGFLSGLFRPCK